MFSKAKIGDRVWSFEFGFGKVTKIGENGLHVCFKINGKNKSLYYTFDGRRGGVNSNQTLFWDEIKFKIPSKPKRKVKKWGVIINIGTNGGIPILSIGTADPGKIVFYGSPEEAMKHNSATVSTFEIEVEE